MKNNQIIREELLQSVDGLSDTQINERVEEGSWTIAQVLMHLYLLERAITKTIVDQIANGNSTNVEDKPIHLVTDRRKKIVAPSFLEPKDDFTTLEDIKEKLTKSRDALIGVVDQADKSLLELRAMPHPLFGAINLKQAISFIGLHEKRHLEQIEEVKKRLID